MTKARTLVEPLTKRELEILALLAAKYTNQEIAADLSLSLNSVKWFARQIYTKLGVNNRRQAAEKAVELGLLVSAPALFSQKDSIPFLPSGTVTFFFTDIEGSTSLWERIPLEMEKSVAQHHALLRQAIEENGGQVFQIIGDAFQAAFRLTTDGLRAALAAQRALQEAPWGKTGRLKVRMGLHTGPAELDPLGNAPYAVSHTLNRAARIMSAGHGGQILLSQEAKDLVERQLPEGVTLFDLGEHQLKGMQLPEHLYQVLAPDIPAGFPSLPTSILHLHNLPLQLTSFIGRALEIDEVCHMIDEHRLVTLIGSGGAGKTRLSLRVAQELLPAFADGAWQVELAPISDPTLVPQGVARSLGLSLEGPAGSLKERLVETLRSRRILLVLDNCEHLVDAVAQFTESLLLTCPHLRILATSREVLGVPGEMAHRVPSLQVPPAGYDVLQAAQYEAVQLFIERVRAVQPSFTLRESNAAAAVHICHRLDGMPLAIELAAARANILSVEQIAERLEASFGLLASSSRTALSRHQTLRATIDWSYSLLSEPERWLLRRLSVFVGGWSLEAAEAVCVARKTESSLAAVTQSVALGDGEPPDGIQVLDLLSRIVDKSLVQVDRPIEGEPRYHLLETIRQYLHGKLEQAGETDATRQAHLAYFLQLAEKAEHLLVSKAQLFWLNRIDQDHDNLREALRYSIDNRLAEAALRMTGALFPYYEIRSNREQDTNLALSAVALGKETAGTQDSVWLAKALVCAGALYSRDNKQAGQQLLEEALQRYQRNHNTLGIGRTIHQMGLKGNFHNDPTAVRRYLEEALPFLLDAGDHRNAGRCLSYLGYLTYLKDNAQSARSFLERGALELAKTGDTHHLLVNQLRLAQLAWFEGDTVQARSIIETHLPECRRYGGLMFSVYLHILAGFLTRLGEYGESGTLEKESYAISRMLGEHYWAVSSLIHLGEMAFLQGNLTPARDILEKSTQESKGAADDLLPLINSLLGEVALKEGDLEQAETLVEAGIAFQANNNYRKDTHYTYLSRGNIALAKGRPDLASAAFRQSLEWVRERNWIPELPARLEALAKVAAAEGSNERSTRLFASADALRRRLATPLPPVEEAENHNYLEAARAGLDPTAFKTAWDWGQTLPVEEMVKFALEVTTNKPPSFSDTV